jgi:hypothetical protein
MRNQDLSSREPATPHEPAAAEPAFVEGVDRPRSTGRREFLKKATLASAPVILTVASRPAWGHPCAPSGMCSGNASVKDVENIDCSLGYGPDDYEGSAPWPPDVDVNHATYASEFGLVVGAISEVDGQPIPDKKLKNIIKSSQGTEFQRAAVAALLNAYNGYMPYLSPDPVGFVKWLVRAAEEDGALSVGPSCCWGPQDVLDYCYLTFTGGVGHIPGILCE